MRIIEELKIELLFKMHQIILLDNAGRVYDSCDALFPTSAYREQSIFDLFPMVESIFSSLQGLRLNDPEIRLTKVEHPAAILPGFYDFVFKKVEYQNKEMILLSILDFTKPYEDFLAYQQRRNEFEIKLQRQELARKRLEE